MFYYMFYCSCANSFSTVVLFLLQCCFHMSPSSVCLYEKYCG